MTIAVMGRDEMDDMISRQAAIDALKRDEALVRAFGYQHAIDAVQELPSTQPEHLVKESGNLVNGLVNDCISRQAAVDALMELVEARYKWKSDASGEIKGINAAYCAIEDLPSAQPQRMRGKWIGGEFGRCSVCGHEGNASDIWNGCKGIFCPNCGAALMFMAGDDDE